MWLLLLLIVIVLAVIYRKMEKMSTCSPTIYRESTIALIDVPPMDSGRPSMYVPSPYRPSYTRRTLIA